MFLRAPQQALRRRLAEVGGWAPISRPAAACAAGSRAAAPSTPDAIAAAAAPPRPPRNLRRLAPEGATSGVCSVAPVRRLCRGGVMDSSPPEGGFPIQKAPPSLLYEHIAFRGIHGRNSSRSFFVSPPRFTVSAASSPHRLAATRRFSVSLSGTAVPSRETITSPT